MVTRSTLAIAEKTVNELWWTGAIQGALAIFFGITALFWPALTLLTLVYLFSAFILTMGVVEVINGLMSIRRRTTWWMTLLLGAIGVGVGIYLLRHTDISIEAFILIVGVSLIARGLLDLVRAFLDAATPTNRTLSIVAGIAAVVAGILILMNPSTGGVAFVWVLGLYALIFGPIIMAISFELRNELLRPIKELERSEEQRDDHRDQSQGNARFAGRS